MHTLEFLKSLGKSEACVNWPYSVTRNGYGQVRLGPRMEKAHRAVYCLHYGAISKNYYVCHKCNNKKCVNIAHLYLASPRQNILDAKRDGLLKKGETHPSSKLTELLVKEIRSRNQNGETTAGIARSLKISEGCARDVLKKRTWKHI